MLIHVPLVLIRSIATTEKRKELVLVLLALLFCVTPCVRLSTAVVGVRGG